MIEPEAIGWWNTGFPLVVLAVSAIVVPRVIVPHKTLSHRAVAIGMVASAMMLLVIGAIVFAGVYSARMNDFWGDVGQDPSGAFWFFGGLSVYSAMLWAPILALVWFGMAQGVEKRRGDAKAEMQQ